MNHAAIERGVAGTVKVEMPGLLGKCREDTVVETEVNADRPELKKFVKEILEPASAPSRAIKLPVSAFKDTSGRYLPAGLRCV